MDMVATQGSAVQDCAMWPRERPKWVESDVEAEVHHITFGGDVVLAFDSPLARILGAGFAIERDVIVIGNDLGLDEALLKRSEEHTSELQSR